MGKGTVARILKSLVYVDLARRKKMIRREAWFAITASHAALLAAWTIPGTFDTSSQLAVLWTWAMMMIRVLYFHIGLLLAVIALVALLKKEYRMATCCMPLVVLTVILPFLNFGPRSSAPPASPVIRIVSANLLMINQNTLPLLDEIAQADADVIFLQEYTDHWNAAFKNRFGTSHPHQFVYPQEDSFGAAIFSRHPFIGPPTLDTDMGKWSVAQLTATIDFKGTPIECRNIHLTPPRSLSYTVEHFDEMKDFIPILERIRSKHVIIAGDFNFTGSTLQARAMEIAGFRDAFADAGTGRGTTWPVNTFLRYLPGLRLDHIFLSPSLSCRKITTGTGQGSDHRPLVAEISITPAAISPTP